MGSKINNTAWLEGNFCIPADHVLRKELRLELESILSTDQRHLQENAKAMTVVLARLTAINAYNAVFLKEKKTKKK
jgi:hypothetical protein